MNKYENGTERQQFTISALRIGVLALRQASGVVYANAVRTDGEHLVGSVGELLSANTTAFLANVPSSLKTYFDPSEGQLPQRLDRLIRKEGGPTVGWTWNGNDEMDPAQRRGWAVVKGDELHGMIHFHGGDDSDFVEKKESARKRNHDDGGNDSWIVAKRNVIVSIMWFGGQFDVNSYSFCGLVEYASANPSQSCL